MSAERFHRVGLTCGFELEEMDNGSMVIKRVGSVKRSALMDAKAQVRGLKS